MKDLKELDNSLTNNSLLLIDKLQTEIERLKIDRIIDHSLVRYLDYFQNEIEKIRTLICENVRYEHTIVQNEIDRLYRTDKNLNGVNILLNWSEGENYGTIYVKIGKS